MPQIEKVGFYFPLQSLLRLFILKKNFFQEERVDYMEVDVGLDPWIGLDPFILPPTQDVPLVHFSTDPFKCRRG